MDMLEEAEEAEAPSPQAALDEAEALPSVVLPSLGAASSTSGGARPTTSSACAAWNVALALNAAFSE